MARQANVIIFQLTIFIGVLLVLTIATCPPGGTWSEWSAPTNCNDTCGNCGYVTITRTCESEKDGCPCEGSSTADECCNPTPCPPPRESCCSPFKLVTLNGATTCGVDGAATTIAPTTEPPITVAPSPTEAPTVKSTPAVTKASSKAASSKSTRPAKKTTPAATKKTTPAATKKKTPKHTKKTTPAATIATSEATTPAADKTTSQAESTQASSTTSPPASKSTSTSTPSVSTASSPSAPTSTAIPLSSTTVSYGNCCPDNGVWSSWKLVIPCTDSCGSCAKTVHERTCLSASFGCLCKGEYTKQTRCALVLVYKWL